MNVLCYSALNRFICLKGYIGSSKSLSSFLTTIFPTKTPISFDVQGKAKDSVLIASVF